MYRVTHNGVRVEFFDSMSDAMDHIQDCLDKIVRHTLRVEHTDEEKNTKVLIYQYSTLYCEMFFIEKI